MASRFVSSSRRFEATKGLAGVAGSWAPARDGWGPGWWRSSCQAVTVGGLTGCACQKFTRWPGQEPSDRERSGSDGVEVVAAREKAWRRRCARWLVRCGDWDTDLVVAPCGTHGLRSVGFHAQDRRGPMETMSLAAGRGMPSSPQSKLSLMQGSISAGPVRQKKGYYTTGPSTIQPFLSYLVIKWMVTCSSVVTANKNCFPVSVRVLFFFRKENIF